MINPQQLRIGNLVHVDMEMASYQLHSIVAGDFGDIHNKKLPLEWINPILLTSSWLKKLGFKNKGEWCQLDFQPRMTIRFHNGNSAEMDVCQDGKFIAFKHDHIKYVHELQNLYFLLSKQELSIK